MLYVPILQVALYQCVPDKATGAAKWAYLDRKQPHSHDVRALTALQPPDSDPLLLSGGNDGQIMLYNMPNFLKQHPCRQSKAPQRPLLQLSSGEQPVVVLQVQQRQINLWQLGKAAGGQELAAPTAGMSRERVQTLASWRGVRVCEHSCAGCSTSPSAIT